jgi:hypothetical protein
VRATPSASATIDAPIDVVWGVMLDTEAYGEWNPFVERLESPQPPVEDSPIVLHVRWASGKTARSPERIVTIEPPREGTGGIATACLSYVYEGLPSKLGLVKGVRHQRLRQSPGGQTSYDTVEEFSGPLVRFAGPDRVAEGFARHAAALKQRAEELARRG